MLGGGGNVLGLIFRIGTKGTPETKDEIKSLRTAFEKEVAGIKASGTDAFLSVGNSAGFSTSQLAGFSAVLPIVAAGVTAVVGTTVALGVALFELTKKTADYGDEIWHAHEKTSLSVETISALKIAGDEANVSMTTLATGLTRFTNNLAMADSGNKKFMAEFAQLGVKSFKDTDKALSEFLTTFATLRTDQERTLAASQAFGVRMGASFVAMFNRIGGDMEGFKEHLRSLGLLLDTEQAKESHQFNILYKQVSAQLAALGRQIGFETMPIIAHMFYDTSKGLQENQDSWKRWGDYVAMVLVMVEGTVLTLYRTMKAVFSSWSNILASVATMGAVPLIEMLKTGGIADQVRDKLLKDLNTPLPEVKEPTGPTDFSLPDASKGKKAKKDNQPRRDAEADLDVLKKEAADRQLVYQQETEKLKHQYDTRLMDISAFIAAAKAANDKRQDDLITNINDQQAALDAAHAKGLIKEDEYLKKNAELKKDTDKIVLDHDKEQDRIEKEDYKTRLSALEKHNADVLALDKKDAEIRLAEIKDAEDRNTKTHTDAAKERIDIEMGLLIKQREFLRAELAVAHEGSEEYKGIQQKLAILDKDVTITLANDKRVIRDARQQDIDDLKKKTADTAALIQKGQELNKQATDEYIMRSFERRRADLEELQAKTGIDAKLIAAWQQLARDEEDFHHKQVMAEIDAQAAEAHSVDIGNRHKLEIEKTYNRLREQELQRHNKATGGDGAAPPPAVLTRWQQFAKDVRAAVLSVQQSAKTTQDVLATLGSAGMQALNGLAQGIGNMVGQWVLMGNQADMSMKKMVAAVLAGVASQAAAMAVMSFAYGLLALTPWGAALFGPASEDFQAAALFASIAVGAGIAGRLIAGNSFQSTNTATTGAAAGGSSSAGSAATAPAVTDLSRLRGGSGGGSGSQSDRIDLHVHVTRDEGSTVRAFVKDFVGGGKSRQVILSDGVLAGG